MEQFDHDGRGAGGGVAAAVEESDVLLACLQRVGQWHGTEINREAVLNGLPLKDGGHLTPELLLRAANRAGFSAHLSQRKLKDIPKAVLPAILLLKGERAGVLMPPGSDGSLEFCCYGGGAQTGAAGATLKKDYLGYVVLLQPRQGSDHIDEHRPDLDTPAKRARWFWRTMWQFRGDCLRLLPASFLVNFLALAMPFFTMLVYDRVVPNNAVETLYVLAFGIAVVFGFEYLLRLLRSSMLERSGRELDMVLGSELYEQILSMEMRARPASAGTLAARAKAYESLREFFISAAVLALTDVPFALLMIGVVFYIGTLLGWIVVAAVVLILLVEWLVQAPLRRSVAASSEAGMERQAFVSETINGLESIKASNAEGGLQHRFDAMITRSAEKDVRSHWYSMLGSSTTKTLMNFASVAVVVGSVFLIQEGAMTMGGMFACTMMASRIMMPLAMVSGLMARLQQTMHALKGLNALMALPRETGDGRKFIQHKPTRLDYRLSNVSVSYPGQTVPALKDVSLTIRQGERIALLGWMGSGKSTLLRVLAKLYDISAGEILLDGTDLAQYHPAVVRGEVGYLPQGGAVLCGTLRENVTLGTPGATDEEIMQALRMAGLGDYVARNPNGLYAQVGEQGSMLSGGQRQALVLARVLLRRPKMLLLDEPTASLDLRAEEQFISCLKAYLAADPQRSLIVATHRTNIVGLVSRVIVLHEGKVHRDGPAGDVLQKLSGGDQPAAPPAASPPAPGVNLVSLSGAAPARTPAAIATAVRPSPPGPVVSIPNATP